MFRRKNRTPAPVSVSADESVGVGAVVTVTGGLAGDSGWVGEPTGVVIAPGDNEMAGYPGLAPGGPISWLVAFAEPAYKVGNAVPFDEATVAARYVKLLPSTEVPHEASTGS